MASISVLSYESTIEELEAELQEKKKLLHKAGQIGNQLLEDNNEMNKHMENLRLEQLNKVEALEQEKHSLQLKLDRKSQLEHSYAEEVESLKHALRKQHEEYVEFREAEHAAKVAEKKSQIESLQSKLDSAILLESQLREKNHRLEDNLQEVQEQLQLRVNMLNETCSGEIAELHMEVRQLQAEKMSLHSELREIKDHDERVSLQHESLQQQMLAKDAEIQERACLATSYYNALEKSRLEVQELNVQLDVLKMETQGHKKKGNSIFAELDDRRADAEKKLISVQVQHESLKKQYEINKQHLHKLKMRMATLLQMSSGQADTSHIERLKEQLSRARGEINILTDKLHKFQKLEKSQIDRMIEVGEAFGGNVDRHLVKYLQELLKSKESEVELVQRELQTARMLNTAEKNKTMKLERELYSSELASEKHRNDSIRLALKLEEYKLKYEPDFVIPVDSEVCKKGSSSDNKKYRIEIISDKAEKSCKQAVSPALTNNTVTKRALGEKVGNIRLKCGESIDMVIKTKPSTIGRRKTVTLSDEITVIDRSMDCSLVDNSVFLNDENDCSMKEDKMAGKSKTGRARGREQHQKEIKAPPVQDEGTNECATQ